MATLITGGAGYIGSHTLKLFHESSKPVVVIDNFSTGHRWAIPKGVKIYEGEVGNTDLVSQIITEEGIDSVIHFAASIEVEESVRLPEKYYANNTFNTFNLLSTCLEHGVSKFIFSSTAATYGAPETSPILEDTTQLPINPYGSSKLMMERLIKDLSQGEKGLESNFRYVILRYFNVAGATSDLTLGQAYPKSTHLIKIASEAVVGKRDGMKVFGTDYATPDGTCVRDYIHVDDLAMAHLNAFDYLKAGGSSDVFNCGYGHGFSVKEVISAAERVSESKINVTNDKRRAGDPPTLVAHTEKIRKILGWEPKYDDIEYICDTAIKWERKLQSI